MEQAIDAFGYSAWGVPTRNIELERRVDYYDAYCQSVNRARNLPDPSAPKKPWWRFW